MTKPTNKKELSKKPIKQKKDTSSLDVSFFVFMLFSTFLTSSLRTPKIFVKEFSYFLMPCH